MANSIETWFTALTYQNKQLFLVTLGANLTAFARQAIRLGELRGTNEIHHHIYQAINTMSVGQLTFSADEFWEALNSIAKEYRLDMALHHVLETSKMLIEKETAQCADYKQNSVNNDSAVKDNVTRDDRETSRGWPKRRSHLTRYWGNVAYYWGDVAYSFRSDLRIFYLDCRRFLGS